MATHRISNPNHKPQPVAPFAAQVVAQSTSSTLENIMSDNTRTSEITSTSFAKQLAWSLRLNISQACTIIDRRAKNQGTPESQQLDRDNLRSLIGQLKWAYDNVGDAMKKYPIVDEVSSWIGGGFPRKVTAEEQKQIQTTFNVDAESAVKMAEQRNSQMRAMLAIRRQGKLDAMVTQLEKLLASDIIPVLEPTTDAIRNAGNRANRSAFMFGNWAEIILIKDDMMYHLGEEPEQIKFDADMEAKAEAIRNKLVELQAERAAEDARALADFDVMSIAA